MVLGKKLMGVGVDSISWTRLQKFLDTHSSEFVTRLLSPSEKKFFLQNPRPLQTFARYFAAKEAYFKAAGGIWMGGASSFSEIQVDCNEEKFSVREEGVETYGNFFSTPDGLGASVLVWKKREQS